MRYPPFYLLNTYFTLTIDIVLPRKEIYTLVCYTTVANQKSEAPLVSLN